MLQVTTGKISDCSLCVWEHKDCGLSSEAPSELRERHSDISAAGTEAGSEAGNAEPGFPSWGGKAESKRRGAPQSLPQTARWIF